MMSEKVDIQPVMRSLVLRIKERRNALGLSQEKLAERAGLSSNFLARVEMGEKTPSVRTLVQLAKALEVRVFELLEEDVDAKWLDEAWNVARALEDLSDSDAQYALGQFRNTIDYLKKKQSEHRP
jgi:transcriptional regulator with XRE-family HTH domain